MWALNSVARSPTVSQTAAAFVKFAWLLNTDGYVLQAMP